MNIGGALGTIGNEPIGSYPWGELVAKICNTHLPADGQIALTDTGSEVMGKIVIMEDKIQITILTLDIGSIDGACAVTDKTNHVKVAAVIISLAMATIGFVITFIYNTAGGSEEETRDTFKTLFLVLKQLFELLIAP